MGVCHEKLKLLAITEVIRNIRGGVGAGIESENNNTFINNIWQTHKKMY